MKKRKAKRRRKRPRTLKPLTLETFARLQFRKSIAEFKKAIKQKSKALPRDSAPLLFLRANGRLRDLFQLAKKGDREAARYLLSVLTDNVEFFLNLCSKNPKLAREIRFPGAPWPMLHTQLEVNREGYLTVPGNHVLRKLGIIRKGRTFSEEALGTRVAKQLYREMDFYRGIAPQNANGYIYTARDATHAEQIKRIRGLKPLDSSNYVDWWKAAEPLFLQRWGGEFQDHAVFKNWNSAAYEVGRLRPHETARSAKRRDIKRALKQGFKSLAISLQKSVPNHPG